VSARADATGAHSPAVTLGKGQLANLGRAGVRAGIAVAAGLALALMALLVGRRGEEEGSPPPPPGAPPRATSIRV
jgi:hypothetical protein